MYEPKADYAKNFRNVYSKCLQGMSPFEVKRAGLNFQVGENVMLEGLTSKKGKSLNRHCGKLMENVEATGRWRVKMLNIIGEPIVAIKQDNLRLWTYNNCCMKTVGIDDDVENNIMLPPEKQFLKGRVGRLVGFDRKKDDTQNRRDSFLSTNSYVQIANASIPFEHRFLRELVLGEMDHDEFDRVRFDFSPRRSGNMEYEYIDDDEVEITWPPTSEQEKSTSNTGHISSSDFAASLKSSGLMEETGI